MAILGGIQTGLTIADTIGDIFGNPKDAKRKEQADALYSRARNGDTSAYVQLRCLSGDQSARADAIRLGFLTQDEIARGTPCGYATNDARQYAANLVTRLKTETTIAQTAATVTAGSAQAGVNANPGVYTAGVVSHAAGADLFPTIPTWVFVAAGAAVFVWLARRR